MRTLSTILCFLIAFASDLQSQDNEHNKIDSLKRILSGLKDSTRIDCLNELSAASRTVQIKTASAYAKQALREAQKIPYVFGMAEAYKNLSIVEIIQVTNLPAAEKYAKASLALFEKTNNHKEIALGWHLLGYTEWVTGQFPAALEALQKAERLFLTMRDTSNLLATYFTMSQTTLEWGHYDKTLLYALKNEELSGKESNILGNLYNLMGDYDTALDFFYKEAPEGKNWQFKYLSLGETYFLKQQYDSALHYYNLFADWAKAGNNGARAKVFSHLGELHFALNNYDTALVYLNDALAMHKAGSDMNQVMSVLKILSSTCREKGDSKRAMQAAQELLHLATETGARQQSSNAHFLLYRLFDDARKTDSAYYHLQKHAMLKDSLEQDLSAQKLAFYRTKSERERAHAKILILNKETKLQQQLIQQTAEQKNFLAAGLIALLLIGFVLFRNTLLKRKNERNLRELAENELIIQKLESEKQQARLQQQATELEMQALRTQMNPHFIFNSLNAINGFILTNETESAADYLTKFSRLIRMVLRNSEKRFISLEEELETLELYLHMESRRMKNHLHYQINCDDTIDRFSIYIPPMLLQPFAENAIWHGLANKEGSGELTIDLHAEDDMLHCKITDNGVGRSKAKQKHTSPGLNKSMGIQITKTRLNLLNQELNVPDCFEIDDLKDRSGNAIGTRVSLKIKIKETEDDII